MMARLSSLRCWVALLLCHASLVVDSFTPPLQLQPKRSTRYYDSLHVMRGMLQDLLNQAFENDSSLSQEDKLKGGIEGPGDNDNNSNNNTPQRTLTSTQQAWRQKVGMDPPQKVTPELLSETELDLFLTGIPNKDPSNDLFASKVNISSRDRQIGLALPETPTVSQLRVNFSPDGTCRLWTSSSSDNDDDGSTAAAFVDTETPGDWRLSDDGQEIRFRFRVTGYTRRIETTGTIQKIYWSQQDEVQTATSTEYTVPAGWLYAEAPVGVVTTTTGNQRRHATVDWSKGGLLKVEQTVGLLGAASKMIPCGKFTARALVSDE